MPRGVISLPHSTLVTILARLYLQENSFPLHLNGTCDFSSVFVQNHTLPPSGVKPEVQLLLVRRSSSFVGGTRGFSCLLPVYPSHFRNSSACCSASALAIPQRSSGDDLTGFPFSEELPGKTPDVSLL